MDCINPILELCTTRSRDLLNALFRHIISMEGNIKSFRTEMSQLKSRRDDVKREVDAAERQGLKRRNEVDEWLRSVEALEGEAAESDEEFNLLFRCFCDIAPNVLSRYQLSSKATGKLELARGLRNRSDFSKMADALLPDRRQEMPSIPSVGSDATLEELLSAARRSEVGVIGIYGMGGVGKTTLLNRFNNELGEESFDMVIHIEVSKDLNIEKIQRAIVNSLKLQWQDEKDPKERASMIFHNLSKMKFAVLLDDVWEPIDLHSVGIPIPHRPYHSKIILATRVEDVCSRMDAQEIIKVELLPWHEAWDLFLEKAGKLFVTSHREIESQAMILANMCGGLPVSLTTIGRAMATQRTLWEWGHAVKSLNSPPAELEGMEEHVLHCLKRSYDYLNSEALKLCFLYCSLYPEGFSIDKRWLVDFWVGEGIIDNFDDMEDAYGKGYAYIGKLQSACLLEKGDDEEQHVRMHRMVRYMALWIASECGVTKNNWLVQAGTELTEVPEVEKWREAERISLANNKITVLPKEVDGSHLVSLMLGKNPGLKSIPCGFFQSMSSLRVLDLSGTNIEELPAEIKMLTQLRHLDLWNTGLKALPEELGDLQNLRYLQLGITPYLTFIPRGLLSRLSATMQVLRMFTSYRSWNVGAVGGGVSFEEVEGLKRLKGLDITLSSSQILHRICASPRLARSVRRLHMHECGHRKVQIPSTLRGMKSLQWLYITSCNNLEELEIGDGDEWSFPSLERLTVGWLDKAKIIWRGLRPHECPQNLVILRVHDCPSIEQLIGEIMEQDDDGDVNVVAFPKLMEIHLSNLYELQCICSRPLIFPSLRILNVHKCPQLKRLPFGPNSAQKIQQIRGEGEWWHGLEWEKDNIRNSFLSSFKQW